MEQLMATLRPTGMRPVQRQVLDHMLTEIRGQTSDVLMTQYGISYNTWRKIRAGDPIRQSVAERLEQRVFDGITR